MFGSSITYNWINGNQNSLMNLKYEKIDKEWEGSRAEVNMCKIINNQEK